MPYSSGQLVRILASEGYRITSKRLYYLCDSGHVKAPLLIGPIRVWSDDDLAHVRRVLEHLDGHPQRQNGGAQ